MDSLPTEIIQHILLNLDLQSLIKTRQSCRRLKQIVDYVLSLENSWEKFCRNDFSHFYKDIERKSYMPFYNIYRNAWLWCNGNQITHRFNFHTSTSFDIKNIQVYKNTLSIISSSGILFYDLLQNKLFDFYPVIYEDRLENNFMIVLSQKINENKRKIYVFGKTKLDEKNNCPGPEVVVCSLFCLHENICFYFNNRKELWGCKFEDKVWTVNFYAKFYNPRNIIDLFICEDEIYILVQHNKPFKLMNRQFVPDTKFPKYFFNYINDIDSFKSWYSEVLKYDDIPKDTCNYTITAKTVHGHILIIGYDVGYIDLFYFKVNTSVRFKKRIKIECNCSHINPVIKHLDVFELEDHIVVIVEICNKVVKFIKLYLNGNCNNLSKLSSLIN